MTSSEGLRRLVKKGSKRHPPKAYLNSERFVKETWTSPRALLLGTRVKNCRGVPFRGQKGLGGCRLEEASKNGGVQGGRGVGGKVNLPPYKGLIHAEGRRIVCLGIQ